MFRIISPINPITSVCPFVILYLVIIVFSLLFLALFLTILLTFLYNLFPFLTIPLTLLLILCLSLSSFAPHNTTPSPNIACIPHRTPNSASCRAFLPLSLLIPRLHFIFIRIPAPFFLSSAILFLFLPLIFLGR